MAQRDETRSAGRHRGNQVRRHRAPLAFLAGDRGRATLLTAALGAALATGVAGGTAAAAAHQPAVPVADIAPVESLTATDPAVDAGPWKPPAEGEASAARRKLKPRVVITELKQLPAGWVNPNPSGRVTSCFGQRWGRLHAGVDIAGPDGSPILAAGAGVVVRAGAAQGYGNAVLIDHGNGYLTHYGHMSAIAVHEGQRVEAGEQIGDEGSTGHSTGPHLHFEVHLGFYKNPIEPVRWLHERGVTLDGCAPA
ncbi:M23 family metallopeptidase [Paractinoplanes lichenicola]|uniref:M23 family metallopeptidase n=1 Tax=Paractinoplanes lichenicola TaxID=2802976 RepID=UPI0027DDCBA5|nr:M23 family metallopeptidase [Actinoplanes lichenicola]